jgi:murein DD-endopeptidase MepM/ murein hydrolase activator NlpD
MAVASGQQIGQVGLSGKTEFPHLHLTVRHGDQVVDPFAFGVSKGECGAGASLWSAEVQALLTYRERAVLNAGFAPQPVTMDLIEAGKTTNPVDEDISVMVAFVRTIGLKVGDSQRLLIRAPDHLIIADHSVPALDRNKAQTLIFVGARRLPAGWMQGTYTASYMVTQELRVVLDRSFETSAFWSGQR